MSIPKDSDYRWHRTNFHLIPGRLRIGVPGLLNSQDFAHMMAHSLARFPGVKSSCANPVTGQVLINFDPVMTDLGLILSWIICKGAETGKPESPITRPTEAIKRSHLKQQRLPMQGPGYDESIPWHALDNSTALSLLGSCAEDGLSNDAAEMRLAVFGFNELEKGGKSTFWKIVLESLKGFMVKLLLAAGGVSLLVGEKTDAAVITAIVVTQAVVEAAQNCRAEKSLDNLKEFSSPSATVLREGCVAKIPGKGLVPGDILCLDAGDIVPADAKIIESVNLSTNEACLTGESIPVAKDDWKKSTLKTPVADQDNMLFSGTSIIGGRTTAVVVATGMQTELGRIAKLLGGMQGRQTNLQKQLDHLGKNITRLVVNSVGAIAIINLFQGRPLWDILRNSISLAVGAVPEGLPAVLTVALSTGVQRMVKRNAVVRDMAAVETLGSTTVICTDKTGTLTKNEMTVKELYINQCFYNVTGDGYKPSGEIRCQGDEDKEHSPAFITKTLKAVILCNNAELRPNTKGKWTVLGDPTEGALLTVAAKMGLWWQNVKDEHCRLKEIAFDSRRRLMSVVCMEAQGGHGVYVKGAPDAVLDRCSFIIGDSWAQSLDERERNKILAANDAMAQKALRVLAVAYKALPVEADLNKMDLESDLVFCGLIGMIDTPREGVKEAIQKCRTAGIKVVMITGDHQKTAEAIAGKLGLLDEGASITGKELEGMTDAEFVKQVDTVSIYSRTTPDQKLRIVRALKDCGQVVAMTGDGVNDAPAIKEADIGIAMGLTGTDVTRDVAGITLSDDNFVTIVNGIEEGRTLSMNLSKSIRYILSGSVSQLLTVFVSAVLGLPTPLLPSQILWINLVTESLPAMSLTADPPEQDCMNRPPLNPHGRFLPDQGRTIVQKGMLFGMATFCLYAAGLTWGGWSLDKARSMAFSQLVVNRMFSLISKRKAGAAGITDKNPLILPAAAMSMVMLTATMYLPFMRPLFSTVPIAPEDWAFIIANAFITDKINLFLTTENKGGGHHRPGPAAGAVDLGQRRDSGCPDTMDPRR